MGISEIVSEVKARVERDVAEGRAFLEEKLPVLSDLADKAAANPVIDSILAAEHLSPEFLSALAAVIDKTEADLAAADEAKKAAEAAVQPAEPPAAPVPDDVAMVQPDVAPVG